jgi:hypothetical protein
MGNGKENLKLQSAITFKLIYIRRKNFSFDLYSSDSVRVQHFVENLSGLVNCCVDLIGKVFSKY